MQKNPRIINIRQLFTDVNVNQCCIALFNLRVTQDGVINFNDWFFEVTSYLICSYKKDVSPRQCECRYQRRRKTRHGNNNVVVCVLILFSKTFIDPTAFSRSKFNGPRKKTVGESGYRKEKRFYSFRTVTQIPAKRTAINRGSVLLNQL